MTDYEVMQAASQRVFQAAQALNDAIRYAASTGVSVDVEVRDYYAPRKHQFIDVRTYAELPRHPAPRFVSVDQIMQKLHAAD